MKFFVSQVITPTMRLLCPVLTNALSMPYAPFPLSYIVLQAHATFSTPSLTLAACVWGCVRVTADRQGAGRAADPDLRQRQGGEHGTHTHHTHSHRVIDMPDLYGLVWSK